MFLNDSEANPTLLRKIITDDELWVFEYNTSTKHQSMQLKKSHEPRHKKLARSVPEEIDVNFIFRGPRCGDGEMGAV